MVHEPLTPGIYSGDVFHHRHAPRVHKLRYGLFQILIDLDHLEDLKRLKYFGLNRFNLLGFYESDHGPDQATARQGPLKARLVPELKQRGLYEDEDRLFLMSMPRVLGFVFNPISIYFIQKPNHDLRAIVYEVNNTFGDRRSYMLRVLNAPRPQEGHSPILQSHAKQLYVSPFMDMEMGYEFAISRPLKRFRLLIHSFQNPSAPSLDRTLMLTAGFNAHHSPLEDASLLKAFWRYPLMTLGVVFGIHIHALVIFLKGIGFRHRPKAPRSAISPP